MEDKMIELAMRFVIFIMSTFTLTSGILYSELVSGPRDCWVNYFKEKNSKLQYLGVCSLCLSFHIANIIQWLFMPVIDFTLYVGYSLTACGITWILTSFVNNHLWQKAFFERAYNE